MQGTTQPATAMTSPVPMLNASGGEGSAAPGSQAASPGTGQAPAAMVGLGTAPAATPTVPASATQASSATSSAASGGTSTPTPGPGALARSVLTGPRQAAASRPRSAGRAGQLARAGAGAAAAAAATATATAATPQGPSSAGSASSSSVTTARTEASMRQSPRRLAGSRSAASLSSGATPGAAAAPRTSPGAASGGPQRRPPNFAGSTAGYGGEEPGRPRSSGRGSPGAPGSTSPPGVQNHGRQRPGADSSTVARRRTGSPGSRSGTPPADRVVARRRTGSPGPRAGTPGRRRAGSPGPTAASPGVALPEAAAPQLTALQLDDGSFGAGLLSTSGIGAPSSSMSLVDALGRIASALERGGGLGGENDSPAVAGAAAAVAAAASAAAEAPASVLAMKSHGHAHSNGMVPAGGIEDHFVQSKLVAPQIILDIEARMARMERSIADALHQSAVREKPSQEGSEVTPAERAKLGEVDALTARCARLEHEVAELRAQVARRLDAAARDAAASRREAEEARAEASTLRSEVADLMAQLLQAPPPAMSQRSDAASSVTSGPPFTGRTGASAGMQDASVREPMDAVESGNMASPRNSGGAPCSNGEVDDAANGSSTQAGALPSSVKFVPAPLMASESVGNGSGQGPGFSRQILPSRAPARGSLGRGGGSHAGVSAKH